MTSLREQDVPDLSPGQWVDPRAGFVNARDVQARIPIATELFFPSVNVTNASAEDEEGLSSSFVDGLFSGLFTTVPSTFDVTTSCRGTNTSCIWVCLFWLSTFKKDRCFNSIVPISLTIN